MFRISPPTPCFPCFPRPTFLINDLAAQHLLLDRRHVYNTLLEHGIPVPRHCVVDRDGCVPSLAPCATTDDAFEETEEAVRVGTTKISKPFVEKPVNAEDRACRAPQTQTSSDRNLGIFVGKWAC